MTIAQAIERTDTLHPNAYTVEQKVQWLSALDGQIYEELAKIGGVIPTEPFIGYQEDDLNTTLLVPYPYDGEIYNHYLQSVMDRENGEMTRYNRSAALFNNAYKVYAAHCIRTAPPVIGERFRY